MSRSLWAMAPVGELGELKLGKMLDRSKNHGIETGYLRNVNVRWFRFDLADIRTLLASPDERRSLAIERDDLFICEGGEPGRCAVWKAGPADLVFQKALHRFRSSGGLRPKLLMYWLRYLAASGGLDDSLTGTTIKHLPREKLAALEVPVPPVAEQKRIADKLDALLARVDACRDRLDRVPAILKRFRHAVLETAADGELTKDWRSEGGCTLDDWMPTTVSAIADSVFDGPFGSHLKTSDYTDAGKRVVRLENIASLRFVEEKETFIPEAKFEALARHTLYENDVLFSSFVDEEVRVCLLPRALSGKAINKADCFCVRTNRSLCDPRFLANRLASRSTFVGLDEVVHGATRPRINLKQLKEISFLLPPPEEQREIVRRVESLFALADTLEARVATARAQVERLTPALLSKAFRGELVPQDPNDEPASALLARIRQSGKSASDSAREAPASKANRGARGKRAA